VDLELMKKRVASRTRAVTEIGGRLLTMRERQIITRLLCGETNREIAAAFDVSEHTVKAQLGKLYAKVGVKSRLALALRVMRRG
jgi:DNA-binding NarL/FixJ family response regulator